MPSGKAQAMATPTAIELEVSQVDNTDDMVAMFETLKVEMRFKVAAEFVAAQVANNVLVLALQSGRIMRIDLDAASDVDDIDLPKKPNDIGVIKKLFLDPTASHLIICTTLAENYYLHTQSRQPKMLSRLRGIPIESVAWNPSQPTASTREILVGASDGKVYETYIESGTESNLLYRGQEKYLKTIYQAPGAVTGLWVETLPSRPDLRRVLVSTPTKLLHLHGRLGRHGQEGSGSVFARLFETETPVSRDSLGRSGAATMLALTPETPEVGMGDPSKPERIFAWLAGGPVVVGKLLHSPVSEDLGQRVLSDTRVLHPSKPTTQQSGTGRSKTNQESPTMIALTQWHVLQLIDNRIIATNRLDDSVVYDQVVLEPKQKALALLADLKKNTFWLFTTNDINEVVVREEDRHIWSILLKSQRFTEASQYANSTAQRDTIARQHGDYLMKKEDFSKAAEVYGKSSKPFEQVALGFIDKGQKDALADYLLAKLSSFKPSAIMQRVMLTSWLVELYMAKLNNLDDKVATNAELTESETPRDANNQRSAARREFESFIRKYKSDFDRKTVYDIISSHGREEELLFFSTTMDDFNYVVSYWIQKENWKEATTALSRQSNPDIVYKYSSVLMSQAPADFVDVIMRQKTLDPLKLIPAFLTYNALASTKKLNLTQNQAARYLLFEINQHGSSEPAIHNTLLSVYASHPTQDETLLLAYLESQAPPSSITATANSGNTETLRTHLPYDVDFALRLCIQHRRVKSCVYIYSILAQPVAAVKLALSYNDTDQAMSVADRPEHDQALRKKLWLAIAKAVIEQEQAKPSKPADGRPPQPKGLERVAKDGPASGQSTPINTALSLLNRAQPPGTLTITDLLPLLPDFLTITPSLKSHLCTALESYSQQIDELRQEMDASASTSARIEREREALGRRWVLVEPGERCSVRSCGLPLLEKRFWVWGCGHGAHAECVVDILGEGRAGKAIKRRVEELRKEVKAGPGGQRGRSVAQKELDEIVGRECPLCGEMSIRTLDEPFIKSEAEKEAWAL